MQIPLFSVYNPTGENEYLLTTLDHVTCEKIQAEARLGTAQVIANPIVSPFLGLTFRSHDIQVFSYISCTGWLILVGFENGPFNGLEVSRTIITRVHFSFRWPSLFSSELTQLWSTLYRIHFIQDCKKASFSVNKSIAPYSHIQL